MDKKACPKIPQKKKMRPVPKLEKSREKGLSPKWTKGGKDELDGGTNTSNS